MYIKTNNKEVGVNLAAYYQAGKPIEIMGKFFLGNSIGFEYPDGCVEFHGSEVSKVAWSGEGLPPVGTVCELKSASKFTEGTRLEEFPEGTRMLVGGCANFGGHDVSVVRVDGRHFCGTIIPEMLRPIRTPEQIAAEKREADIEELRVLLSNVACDDYHAAVAMIDAGYHK